MVSKENITQLQHQSEKFTLSTHSSFLVKEKEATRTALTLGMLLNFTDIINYVKLRGEVAKQYENITKGNFE